MYILIVDDDPASRLALETLLVSYKHKVCWASTGARALEQLEKERPDLMLLDVLLPDMSGIDVRIKQLQHTDPAVRATPCFIVSGLDATEIHQMARTPSPLQFIQVILGKTEKDRERLIAWIDHLERDRQMS